MSFNNLLYLVAVLFVLSACQQTPNQENSDNHSTASATPQINKNDELTFKEYDIKTVGFLVYDGVNSLDVFGPHYVLGQLMGVERKFIALEPGNIKTVMGIEIVPNTTIDDVDSLDILVIPGGFRGTIEAAYDAKVHQWIRDIDKTTTYTASVCTGGWILASTGLLEGKKATTNWYDAENMLSKYGATFVDERYTNDGKYWTAAGVTAGMDMSLALLAEIAGEDYAQGVMLDMEYDPQPPFAGGSPEKTRPAVFEYMNGMYKAGVDAIIEEMEAGEAAREALD
ncbi:MAG: DJ-1/PfpI family protein [Bacteroidota bacterium]